MYELLFGKRLAWLNTDRDQGSFEIDSFEDALGKHLVDLLGRCAAFTRAGGFDVINTTEVFRQYKLAQPWVRLVFGENALPEIVVHPSDEFIDPFSSGLGFSRCNMLSLQGLARHTPRDQTISEHDVFFDLARFGAGNSVAMLRAAGGTIARINDLSRTLGLGRRTRHGLLEQ